MRAMLMLLISFFCRLRHFAVLMSKSGGCRTSRRCLSEELLP